MKKLSLKKLSCLFLVLVCAVTCISLPAVDVEAAVKKPAKTYITSLRRTAKSSVRLSWKKASGARGYQVYMKTNGGGFKRIRTTSARYINKGGLRIGSSYCFKVRAYKKSKNKTVYGKFSSVKKIKMTSYVYMVNVMSPYSSSSGYWERKGTDSFQMGGRKYYRGFKLCFEGYATWNLNGKFSKIQFILGGVDGKDDDMTIMITGDDEDLRSPITRKKESLPRTYTVNVKNVYKFKIEASGYWSEAGFGNVKLYY